MKFTLQYDGILVSNQQGAGRLPNKRSIRFQIDPQLRTIWSTNRYLRWLRAHEGNLSRLRPGSYRGNDIIVEPLTRGMDGPLIWSPFPYVIVGGLTYIVLVNALNEWTCALDIKILMPEPVGNRGDIDNRLKTLYDALCPPQRETDAGVGGTVPSDGLVFSLLEDDKDRFIRSRRVELEQLLSAVPSNIDQNDRSNYVSARIGITLSNSDGGPVRVAGAP